MGSDVDPAFIPNVGFARAVAVGAGHIYWASGSGSGNGTIGRASLNGTHIDKTFIDPQAYLPVGLAIEAGYIYWLRAPVVVGRAKLDGSEVDPALIPFCISGGCTAASWFADGLAVDGSHVYFSGNWPIRGDYRNAIARANLDGSGFQRDFMTPNHLPRSVAVDGSHVYWTWGQRELKARITSGPSGTTADPTPTFTFSSNGGSASGFECKADTRGYAPCTSPKTVAHLADGPHTFYVRAVDGDGHHAIQPAIRTFTVTTRTG